MRYMCVQSNQANLSDTHLPCNNRRKSSTATKLEPYGCSYLRTRSSSSYWHGFFCGKPNIQCNDMAEYSVNCKEQSSNKTPALLPRSLRLNPTQTQVWPEAPDMVSNCCPVTCSYSFEFSFNPANIKVRHSSETKHFAPVCLIQNSNSTLWCPTGAP